MTRVVFWLRWLAVVPGALVAGFLMTFPLHWFLLSLFSNFIEPYPQTPERLLSPAVIAGGIVWWGAQIAPQRKVETAVVLFGLWMLVLGAVVGVTYSGGTYLGHQLYAKYGGLSFLGVALGAGLGLLLVRSENWGAPPLQTGASKALSARRGNRAAPTDLVGERVASE